MRRHQLAAGQLNPDRALQPGAATSAPLASQWSPCVSNTRVHALNSPDQISSSRSTATFWQAVPHSPRALLDRIIAMSTTRANYWIEFAVSSSLSATFLMVGAQHLQGSWLQMPVTIILGLFAFSFIEYLAHRWVFHGPDSMYQRGHHAHHEFPQGYDSLPFFLPAAILSMIAGLLSALLPAGYGLLIAGTIGSGYVAYGFSHFAMHHHRFQHPLIRRWAARHHVHHHHPDRNFGVTSTLWDHVLGTLYRSRSRV